MLLCYSIMRQPSNNNTNHVFPCCFALKFDFDGLCRALKHWVPIARRYVLLEHSRCFSPHAEHFLVQPTLFTGHFGVKAVTFASWLHPLVQNMTELIVISPYCDLDRAVPQSRQNMTNKWLLLLCTWAHLLAYFVIRVQGYPPTQLGEISGAIPKTAPMKNEIVNLSRHTFTQRHALQVSPDFCTHFTKLYRPTSCHSPW